MIAYRRSRFAVAPRPVSTVASPGQASLPRRQEEEIARLNTRNIRQATTLGELAQLRARLISELHQGGSVIGSAVGFKMSWPDSTADLEPGKTEYGLFKKDPKGERIPAIILFVTEKLPAHVLPENEKLIGGETGIVHDSRFWAYTDVAEGPKLIHTPVSNRLLGAVDAGPMTARLVGGCQLARARQPAAPCGTAGCFIRRRGQPAEVGLLTCEHVAANARKLFSFSGDELTVAAPTEFDALEDAAHYRNGLLAGHFPPGHPAAFQLDASFLRTPAGVKGDLEVHGDGQRFLIQPDRRLKLEGTDLWPVGEDVLGVNIHTGVKEGVVIGFCNFERPCLNGHPHPVAGANIYNDFLILSKDAEAFTIENDSGQLVITKKAPHRPIGISRGLPTQNLAVRAVTRRFFASVTDIWRALDHLQAEFVGTPSVSPANPSIRD